MARRRSLDFELEVFRHLFASVAEEMGVTMQRSAYSPNIKERRDHSCAVFDQHARMIAQAAHVPAHLGAMPMSVRSAIEFYGGAAPTPGDVVILNDPFRGGTHLPDITTVSPVYVPDGDRETLWGWLATRAHHADIGGMAPGSMPPAKEIFQEGFVIPPLKLVDAGTLNEEFVQLLCHNVRTPEERRGDLEAQLASHGVGETRLRAFTRKYGGAALHRMADDLLAYTERLALRRLHVIPDGVYRFEDAMDDDGLGGDPVPIRVTITARRGRLRVDFAGTGAQARGAINAPEAISRSAVIYVIRCLVGADVPQNDGAFEVVDIRVPEGSLLNPIWPAAVSAGNVETSQRVADVVWGALAQAIPDIVPAASQGTMNNVLMGGHDPRLNAPFTYYETIAGGAGAGPGGDGQSAIHVAMSNTLNTPIEALELAYPLRVLRYQVRQGTGGRGRHRGGDGVRRDLEALAAGTLTLATERRRRAPWGLRGGEPGRRGRNRVRQGGRWRTIGGKAAIELEAGDAVSVETPGGGGWGKR